MVAVALALGAILAFGSGNEYSARGRILPYRSGTGTAGLSGLAGLAGIRLPSGSADQTITADLYPEIVKSQDFRIEVAETPLFFSSINRTASTVEYFRDLRDTPVTELLVKYTWELPGHLLSGRGNDGVTGEMVDTSNGFPPLVSYDKEYLKIVNRLTDRLSVSIDKKTSVITISSTMPDPYAAADLVRATSRILMKRIIDYESRKAGEQFRFVREQHAQAQSRYESAQRALALFADRNRSLMSAMSQIDQERLQREYDLTFEMYQQFSRELEQARIKMNQDTPVFTVLEQVTVPTDRSSPKRARILLISMVFGLLLGIGTLGIRMLRAHLVITQSQV